jgi:hypothetical protein
MREVSCVVYLSKRAAVASIRAMPGATASGLPLFYTVKEFGQEVAARRPDVQARPRSPALGRASRPSTALGTLPREVSCVVYLSKRAAAASIRAMPGAAASGLSDAQRRAYIIAYWTVFTSPLGRMLSSTRGNLPVSEVREHIGMSGLLGQRAVVVGAGVGGLSMAGALANCFEQVEILERDRLRASVGSRSGTPQDRHPHALLAGGLRALDEIFPGFADDQSAPKQTPGTAEFPPPALTRPR